jgi:hypothetical protein
MTSDGARLENALTNHRKDVAGGTEVKREAEFSVGEK